MYPVSTLITKRSVTLEKRYFFQRAVVCLCFCLLSVFLPVVHAQSLIQVEERTYAAFAESIQDGDSAQGKASLAAVNIKDGLRHESVKKVLLQVKGLKEGKIGAIIAKFSGADARWTWKLREGRLPRNTNAITEWTQEGVVTTLNYNELKEATKLSVARTIIHEMVHAYLVLSFKYNSNAVNEYPRIVAAYRMVVPAPDLNEIHHREMAINFVGEIATALREYGRKLGLQADDSVYRDLAWGGLDFAGNEHLAEESKIRIQQRLDAEQFDSSVFPVRAVGPQMTE